MGRMPVSRVVSAWLPVAAWAALIFGLSSIPGLGTDLGTWDTILRKGAHVVEYTVFGLLLFRALGNEAAAFGLGLLYSATDEIHQRFVPGRHGSPRDVGFDAAGLLLGVFLLPRIKRDAQR
jgi:VanZ family protein